MHAVTDDESLQEQYLENPIVFIAEYGMQPGHDVTALRDSEDMPDHLKDQLHADMYPNEARVFADALLLNTDETTLGWRMRHLALWLRSWSNQNFSVEGIH